MAGKSDKLRGASKIYVSQAHHYAYHRYAYHHGSTYCAPTVHLPCTYRVPTVYSQRRHVSQARYLNTQALLRKYAPLAFVLMLVLGMLWWRFR